MGPDNEGQKQTKKQTKTKQKEAETDKVAGKNF